jgi:protection-of-telomeres protein 1
VQVIIVMGAPTITNVKRCTNTVVYPAASIPEPAFKQSFLGAKDIPCLPQDAFPRPSKAEQMYALDLKQLVPPSVNAVGTSNTTTIPTALDTGRPGGPPPRTTKLANKSRLIQAVKYDDYCDLAVEVIKKFPNSNGNLELYVTDYTPNPSLYDYPSPEDAEADDDFSRYERTDTPDSPDSNHNWNRDGDAFSYIPNVTGTRRDWPGPSGRHTLQVELLPPHAGFARDRVREGDFIKLSNVRIKQGSAGKMEGNIWTDQRYPDKIQVHPLIEEKALESLKNRRDNYWKAHRRRTEQDEETPRKRPSKKQRQKAKARKAAVETNLHNKHGMIMLLVR